MSELENKELMEEHDHEDHDQCCEHDHEHEHHEHDDHCGCGHDHHEEEHHHGEDHHHDHGDDHEAHHHEEDHHHEDGCGCGHDHDHEDHDHEDHDDHCGCGHDHDGHDHDDHCGCGCDHDHEDGHHHHDEGHKYVVEGFRLVETHKHEGATVCSFECDTKLAGDDAKKAMEEAFISLKDWLNAQGAIIGHVKGFIKENGQTTTFSTVGAELNINSHEGCGSTVGFASIVFGPDEETLKDKVVEEFSRLK